VNGVNYTFDDNGNLLSDGVNTYVYDSANRLVSVSGQSTVTSYTYNGLGDRLSQTVNGMTTNYTLDLNIGLTQVLSDGTTDYLYGNGRIAQVSTATEYFLADVLGSVRQMTDQAGTVTYTQSYDPYGTVTSTGGTSSSPYGFTGETTDANGLIYLRARYYSSGTGRFLSRDTWSGDYKNPITLGKWVYANSNPIIYTDPTGYFAIVKYNRQVAVEYAMRYAVHANPYYGMFESDCTSFVSQALHAGRMRMEMDWFFQRRSFVRRWGHAWSFTDDLYNYLVYKKHFQVTPITGNDFGTKYVPNAPETIPFSKLSKVRKGDVVFYKQKATEFVSGGGKFNHAAFVVGWGHLIDYIFDNAGHVVDRKEYSARAPRVVDHTGPLSDYGVHSINDTFSEVDELVIVHFPDKVYYSDVTNIGVCE
jgi:RHS repeat-associated protein